MLEIYFETYGCSANYNSTEIMQGLVKQAGLNVTSNANFADLIVINSCIVKCPTEEKIRRRVQDLLKAGRKVILAGCMPRIKQGNLKQENLFLLDTSHIKDIINLIHDIQNKSYSAEKYLKPRNEVKLSLPKLPKERVIGITQISEGCLEKCNYCIVRLAKGRLFSYPKEKIIKSVKNDIASGCKEIWLTSQDNANYGSDNKKHLLPELLREILELKGSFYVRVGMMNPNNILEILQELIEIYKHKKMFKFLHIPVQSGSNRILERMERSYAKEDFLKIIKEFKRNIPEITISTDIIVGFPGESDADFRESLSLIKEVRPEMLNISKFAPRPFTKAAKMKQLPPEVLRKRAKELSKLHLEICKENQKNWAGWKGKVLVDQKGPVYSGTYLARSPEYKLFAVHSREKILGKIVKVKVKKIMPHYLISEVIE